MLICDICGKDFKSDIADRQYLKCKNIYLFFMTVNGEICPECFKLISKDTIRTMEKLIISKNKGE